MNVPSSVTGPDRITSTDAGRRANGRGSDNGEDFGSALSAELNRPGADDDQAITQDQARADADRDAQAREIGRAHV